MPSLTVPRVLLWQARAAYVGPGLRLSPHRNAAATWALGLEASFQYSSLDDGKTQKLRSVLIPPHTLHHLQTQGAMVFVYLDAMGDDLATLRARGAARAGSAGSASSEQAAAEFFRLGADKHPSALVKWIVNQLGLTQPYSSRRHNALAAVVQAINTEPQRFQSAQQAAQMAGLSSSHFQHLFRQTMGVPFRRYRLWRRMAVVARLLAADHSLTDAAHAAGFSSSAHLSSSFRHMFGISPVTLLRAGVQIESV
jgi:AraC-like DNA-binding protein